MTVRRLPGTPTPGPKWLWRDEVNHGGWRIQYNRTLDTVTPLNPYRLLGPDDTLWASADTLEEMNDALPTLIEEFQSKDPLFTKEHFRDALITLMQLALAAATKGKAQKR